MNCVNLIGRLTKDPDVRHTESSMTIARFSIAIDRGKDKNGEDKGVDYPSIVCFGKTAELVEKYLSKGRQIGVQGKIQTGTYEKDGKKYYNTEVLADRIEFLGKGEQKKDEGEQIPIPEGFTKMDDDEIPF